MKKVDASDVMTAIGLLSMTVAGFLYLPVVGFAVFGCGLWYLGVHNPKSIFKLTKPPGND